MLRVFHVSGRALLAAALIALPAVALADGRNALRDAGFERDIAADAGGWIPFEHGEISSKYARSGEQSMFIWGFSQSVAFPPYLTGNVSGSYQALPAAPGSRWRLTGYGLTSSVLRGTPAFGIVQVSFFDNGGNDLGTVETADNKTARAKTSNEINLRAPAGEWIHLDTGVATAPEGTTTVQAFTLYVDYSGSGSAQGVYFDDLILCTLADADTTCGDDQSD